MTEPARILAPAATTYRGDITTPENWACWVPRVGDVLVATPPKCGTTWTQTMVAMLLGGRAEVPGRLGDVSPWVDSSLLEAQAMADNLAAQPGRRVVKTHTPGDGFAVWDGVTVIAVYRHPLDVFFSLRKHVANMVGRQQSTMLGPVGAALAGFVEQPADLEAWDRDALATIARHHRETGLSGRIPGLVMLHYADMLADHRGTVVRLADALGVAADAALIDAVVTATGLKAMRAEAARYVPAGGAGLWHDDTAFFDRGQARRWEGELGAEDVARYEARMADLLPERAARRWLEVGGQS